MKKLKLDLDDLRVETFETERGKASRGTVMGADVGEPVTIVEPESTNIYCITVQPCIPTNTDECYSCQASCTCPDPTTTRGYEDLY